MTTSWTRSRRFDRAWRCRPLPGLAVLGVASLSAGLEELPGQRRGRLHHAVHHVERDLQAGAAVQRARVASKSRPRAGGLAEAPEGQERLAVLVDPRPQPRPLAEHGLVGELDRRLPGPPVPVDGEEACLGPLLDDFVDGGAVDPAGELRARRHRRRVGSPSGLTTTSRSKSRCTASCWSAPNDRKSCSARAAIAPSIPPSRR